MADMQTTLQICVYCEQKPGEIVASGLASTYDEALIWVKVGQNHILLCPDCRAKFAPEAEEGYDHLLEGPIDFPPGVTSVEHVCPQREFEGASPEEATSILHMVRDGDYYWAKCPHCEIVVRSLADDEPL